MRKYCGWKKMSSGNGRLAVCTTPPTRPTKTAGHTRPSSSCVWDVITGDRQLEDA